MVQKHVVASIEESGAAALMEDLVPYLIENKDKDKGALFVDNLHIKVNYNLVTGELILSDNNKSKKVFSFFDLDTFPFISLPVTNAISIIAKIELLQRIAKLNDPALLSIIHKKGYDAPQNTIQIKLDDVIRHDDAHLTLQEIQNLFSGKSLLGKFMLHRAPRPSDVQYAVADVLKKYGIENINTKQDVMNVMDKINAKLEQLKPLQPAPQRQI